MNESDPLLRRKNLFNKASVLNERYPDLVSAAKVLTSYIKTEEGVSRFLRGLVALGLVTGKRSFLHLAIASTVTALDQGKSDKVMDFLSGFTQPDIVDQGALTLAQAGELSSKLRARGQSTGWFHGHIRLWQPGSLLAAVLAGEQVDTLFIGMEKGIRTARYKRLPAVLTDRCRESVLTRWPGLGIPVAIQRIEHSDAGYERALRTVRPMVYFGQTGNPWSVRQKMTRRAAANGIIYHELPNIPVFSTSAFLEKVISPINPLSTSNMQVTPR